MKKGKSVNFKNAKHSASQHKAVTFLKVMPMWQRVVCAIMAVLLVFLLWPADAAKTITAWANDTETQVATEEGVTEPDPESPDPGGGGGEESDDPIPDPEPEVDPADDPQADVGGEEASDEESSQGDEFDKNAQFEDTNAPVPNASDTCGPYEWNFTSYFNNNRSFSAASSLQEIQTYDYLDTKKVANLQFVGPCLMSSDKYDGGATSVTENGFETNYYHRLKGSSKKNSDGQIVSNFLVFSPNQDLLSLTISCQAVNTYTRNGYKEYPIIGYLEVDKSETNFYSQYAVTTKEIKSSSSWTDVTWDNNGEGFSKDKKYIIFFKPNSDNDYDYANYGGMKINNIKTEGKPGSLKLSTTNNVDDTLHFLLFDYPDSSSPYNYHIAYEDYFDTYRTEEVHDYEIPEIVATTYNGWMLVSEKLCVQKIGTTPIEVLPNQETTIETSLPYPYIYGKIKNNTKSSTLSKLKVRFEPSAGNATEEIRDVNIAPGSEVDFYFYGVCSSGILTLSGLDQPSMTTYEVYCDASITSKTTQKEIKIGTYVFQEGWAPFVYTINIKELEYGQTTETSAKDDIEFYRLVMNATGGYYQQKLEPADSSDPDTYKINSKDRIRIVSKPYGLWFKDKGTGAYINLNNYQVSYNMNLQLQTPKYEWNTIDAENGVQHYSCTATYKAYDPLTQQEKLINPTITTKSQTSSGIINRETIERATTTKKGSEKLIANFSDIQYFKAQEKEYETEMEEQTHVCQYGTFTKSIKGSLTKLPEPSGITPEWYYLDGDVVVNDVATIQKGRTMNLCLNGYSITMQSNNIIDEITESNATTKTLYNNQGTLNIYDCHDGDANCRHYFSVDSDGTWHLQTSGTSDKYIDGGVITGAQKSAIFNEGTLNCVHVNFAGNKNSYNSYSFGSGSGGGAIRSGTTSSSYLPKLNLVNCDFKGNISQGAGGAVLVGVSNSDCNAGTATIENCYFSENALVGETTSTTDYKHPWGGGALATFSKSASNPVITIKGSEFYYNTSTFRAGAILLFHGTKCYMSDTTVQHNTSGKYIETGHSTSFNYAGGICLYTGFGNKNPNQAFLYLSGKINCTENHSIASRGVQYEDNLGLQVQSLNTKGYITLEKGKLLDPSSVIGVNYIDNHNLDISQGYGDSYVSASEKADPIVKYFILDEVAGRLSYALLIDMSSYELWIVSHTHNLTYTNKRSVSLDMINSTFGIPRIPQEDILSVKCSTGTSSVSGRTFSKCKYEQNECSMSIYSEDGGVSILNKYIPYDGKQHGVIVENKNEFEGIIDEKPIDYDPINNPSGILYYNYDKQTYSTTPPSEPGFYAAALRYYDVQIKNGSKVVDRSVEHMITSNFYEIRGPELTVNVGDITKSYNGAAEAAVSDCWIADEGKVVDGDDVRVSIKTNVQPKVYCEEPFVGKYNITGYDDNIFELIGNDAYKYSIGKVVGTINIEANHAGYTPGEFVLFEDSPSINLNKFLNLPEEVINKAHVTYSSKPGDFQWDNVGTYNDPIYTRFTDDQIRESGHPLVQSEYEDCMEAPTQFHVNSISPVDMNNDGIYEYYFDGQAPLIRYVTGHLIFKPQQYKNCSLSINEPAEGKITDENDTEISNISIPLEASSTTNLQVIIDKDYAPCPYALKITDQKGNVKHIKYSINNPGEYIYSNWTCFMDSKPVKLSDSDPVEFLSQDNISFTCNIIEKPIPELTWEVSIVGGPDQVFQYVGQEITVLVNIKNTGNCKVQPISGSFKQGNGSDSRQWTFEEGTLVDHNDYIWEEPLVYTFYVCDDDFFFNLGNFTGIIKIDKDPGEVSPYYWESFADTWTGCTYHTAPINTGLDVEVVPNITDVEISAETEIDYSITIKNTSNINLTEVVFNSQLLGIINQQAASILQVGDSVTLTSENIPELKLKNINELMIDNNEIKNLVTAKAKYNLNSSNFVEGSGYGLTTIHKKTVVFPTAKNPFTYNGEEQVGVDYDPTGLTADANLSVIDAGTYECTFTLKPWYAWENATYTANYYKVTYTILPKTLTATLTTDLFSQEYNGKAYSDEFNDIIDGYIGDDERISDAAFTTQGVNAQEYGLNSLNISYTNVPNYVLSIDPESKVAITPKTFDATTIGIDTTDLIYNGIVQTTNYQVWDITIGDENPVLLTPDCYNVVSGSTGTNVGNYKLSIIGKGNYAATVITQEDGWNISKASLTVLLTGNSESKVYNGNEQSVVGASVAYSANPQNLSPETIGSITPAPESLVAARTEVGTSCMFDNKTFALGEEQQKNIDATFITSAGILTITKLDIKDPSVTIGGDHSLEYNGNTQNPVITITYNGHTAVLGTDYSIEGNFAKNAGQYIANITAMGTNFSGSTTFNWEIIKKSLNITHEPFSKEYDASFLVDEFNTQPFGTDSSDELRTTVQTSSDIVGTYYASVSADPYLIVNIYPANETTNLDNYVLTTSSLSASIQKKALRVVPQSRSFEYDGNEHSLISNEVRYLAPDSDEDGLLVNHYVDVNNEGVTWSDNNHAINYTDSPIVVSVKTIKITSATIYEGERKDVTSNYNIDYSTTANLEITKLKMTIDVVGNNAGLDDLERIFYDGKTHTVTGYGAGERTTGEGSTNTGKFDASKLNPQPEACSVSSVAPGEFSLLYDGHELSASDFTYSDDNIQAKINYTTGKLYISKKVLTITVNDAKNADGTELVHNIITDKSSPYCETEGLAEGEGFRSDVASTLTTNDVVEGSYESEGTSGFTFTTDLKWEDPTFAEHYDIAYYVRLTIKTQMVITVTGARSSDSAIQYYDGNEHSITGFEVKGTKSSFDPNKFKFKKASEGKDIATGINAGKYYMGLTANDFYYDDSEEINPEIIVNDGYLIIRQKELDDTMLDASYQKLFEYNGQTQGPNFVIKNGEELLLTGRDYYVEQGTAVNVGTYWAVIHGQGNYTGTIENKKWEITKATVQFNIKGNYDVRQYNGEEQTVSGYTYTVDKLAPFIKDENLQLDSDKGTISKTAAGEYVMNLQAANFHYLNDANINPVFTVVDGGLKIEKRKISDIDVHLDPATFQYDGYDHQPRVVIRDFGKDLPLDLFNITGDLVKNNAGTYYINVDAYTDDSNYDGVLKLEWNIEKRFMEVNVSGNVSEQQYNGQEQQVDGYYAEEVTATGMFQMSKVQLAAGKTASAKGVNAGIYYMNLVASDFSYADPNLNVKFNIARDGYLDINPIDISSIDLSVNPSNYVYDGTYKEPTITAKTNYGYDLILDTDYVKEGAKAKNAGAYELRITGIGNFTGTADFDWSISKANVSVEIKGNIGTVTYNGTLQSISGYEIAETSSTGLVANGVVVVVPDSDSVIAIGKDAGTYPMNLYDKQFKTDNSNVNFSYSIVNDGLLTINPVSLNDLPAFGTNNKVYNGKEQTPDLQCMFNNYYLVEGKDYTLSGDTSETNVNWDNDYTLTVNGIGNFTGFQEVYWNIIPAPTTIHINANTKTYTYNGTEQTVSGYIATSNSDLFDSSSVYYLGTEVNVSGTIKGSYTSSVAYVEASFGCNNYNLAPTFVIDNANCKLVINPSELIVSARDSQFYDGNPLQSNALISGLVGEEAATATVKTNSSATGRYNKYDASQSSCFSSTINFTSGSEDNYFITYDVDLNIEAQPSEGDKTIVVYGNSATYTYDGTEKSLNGFSSYGSWEGFDEDKVLCNGEKAVKGTNAGTYKLGLTEKNFTYEDSVDNLTIVYYDGALTITPKQISAEMVSEVSPTSFIYNTKEQGPSVKLMDGTKVLNTDEYELENGTGVNAGIYNLIIKGKGNYTGQVEGYQWVINKAEASVNLDLSTTYNDQIFRVELTPNDVSGKFRQDEISCEFTTDNVVPGVYTSGASAAHKVNYKYEGEAVDNYNINTYVTLRIEKRILDVKPNSKTYVFDGKEHKLLNNEVAFEGLLESHHISGMEWQNNTLTNVGTKSNIMVQNVTVGKQGASTSTDVTSFYDINYHPGTLTVVPGSIAIKVKGNSALYAYDGLSHSVKGFEAWEIPAEGASAITGAFDKDKLIALNECIAVGVEPGTYNMDKDKNNFVYDDANFNDVQIQYEDGSLNISKNSFSSAVMDVRNLTYNGQEQTTSLVVNIFDSEGKATTLKQDVDYEVVYSETSTLTGKDAKAYSVTINGLNRYEGATKTTSWLIKKADVEIAISGLNASKEYTGNEQVFPDAGEKGFKATETSATGLFDEEKVIIDPSYTIQAKGTELGVYSMGINVALLKFNDPNVNAHFTLVKDGSLTITPADITGQSFSASATSFVYNGAEQTTKISVKHNNVELVYGIDYKISENAVISATNVGTYQAKVEGLGNYKGVRNDIYWIISKADMTIKVTGNMLVTEYTGYEQSVSGFKSEAVDGAVKLFDMDKVVICSGKQALAKGTNIGEYTTDITYDNNQKDLAYNDANINAVFIGDKAQTGVITQVKLTINKKRLQINAMDVKSWDGDKLVHSITTKDVDGAVSGQVVSGTVTTSSSDAGTYTDTLLDLTIKVDGRPEDQTPMFNLFKLFNKDPDPRENYDIVNTSALTITSDEQDYIIVKGNIVSNEYNGQKQSLGEKPYTVSTNIPDFDPDKLNVSGMLDVSATNAGEYSTSITNVTYDSENNPNITWTDAKLIITKRSITEAVVESFVNKYYYNRATQQPQSSEVVAQDFNGSVILQAGSDYLFETPQPQDSITPGSYVFKLNADALELSNYKGSLELNYLIFNAKRTVQLTGNYDSFSYDGQNHSISGYSIYEEVPEGQTGKLISSSDVLPAYNDCTVEGTTIGNYPMGLNASEFSYNGSDKNYIDVDFVVKQDGYLEISAGEATNWRVSVDQTEFTYNGKAQGPTVLQVTDSAGNIIDPAFYDISGNSEVNANADDEIYTLTISAKGSYTGTKTVSWKINKAYRVVEIFGEQSLDNKFTGKAQSVRGYTANEVYGEDEAIVDLDLITPAKDTVVAEGTNVGIHRANLQATQFAYGDAANINVQFQIKQDCLLKISKRNLNELTYVFNPEYLIYNGALQNHPTLTLMNGDEPLDPDNDYTLGGNLSGTDVGTYTLRVNAINTGNYEGSLDLPWYIVKADVHLYVVGNQLVKVYDRTESTVSGFEIPDKPSFITDNQIVFNHEDESNPSIGGTDAGVYSYGMQAEDFTCTNTNVNAIFHIQKDVMLTISTKNIADDDVSKIAQNFTYSGNSYTSEPTLTYKGINLTEGADADFIVRNNTGINAGDYSLSIEGRGNYSGFANIDWVIHKLVATVKVNGASASYEHDGFEHSVMGYTLEVTSDRPDAYALINTNLINPGKGRFEGSGTNKGFYSWTLEEAYGGTVPWTYQQENENIDLTFVTGSPLTLTITDTDISRHDVDITYTDEFEYNGVSQSPLIDLQVKVMTGESTWTTLSDSDYEILGTSSATDVFENENYSFSIKGKGNYTGQLDNFNWRIVPRSIVYSPALNNKPYDGQTISDTQEVATEIGSQKFTATLKTKTQTSDGVVDGINVGTYYYPQSEFEANFIDLSIVPEEGTLPSNYALQIKETSVKITDASFSSIDFSAGELTYNGSEQTAIFTGTGSAGETLNAGVDFTVTGNKQINAGTYTATLTNINPNYSVGATKDVSWSINKATLPKFTYSDSKEYDVTNTTNWSVITDYATGIGDEKFDISFSTSSPNAGIYTTIDGIENIKISEKSSGSAKLDNYVNTFDTDITLVINQKHIDPDVNPDIDIYINDPDSLVYNAVDKKDVVRSKIVVKDLTTIVDSSNYDISFNVEDVINAGEYKFSVTAKNNYTGTYNGVVLILPASINYEYAPSAHPYNGCQFTTSVTINKETEGLTEQIFGDDSFNITCATLDNEQPASDIGEYLSTGQIGSKRSSLNIDPTPGSESSKTNYDFNITSKLVISSNDISLLYKVAEFTPSLEYNGMEQFPTIRVVRIDSESEVLDPNSYTIVDSTEASYKHKDVYDNYGFHIVPKAGGNLTGELWAEGTSIPFKWAITKKNISYEYNDIDTYNGSNYSKTKTLTSADGLFGTDTAPITFTTYKDDVPTGDAGTYTFNDETTGNSLRASYESQNYSFAFTGNVIINGKSINSQDISVIYTSSLTYNAQLQSPTELSNFKVSDRVFGDLVEGENKDYTITVEKQTDVPESDLYTFTINGVNNYSGSLTKQWTISPLTVEVTNYHPSQEFSGEAFSSTLSLSSDSSSMVKLPDDDKIDLVFTTYFNSALSSNAGDYPYGNTSGMHSRVERKVIGGSTELRDYNFVISNTVLTIGAKSISDFTVTGVEDKEYNSTTQSLSLSIKSDEFTLTTADYKVVGTISAKDVKESGSYEFHIEGQGNFTGELWDSTSPNVPFKWNITPKAATYTFSADDFTYNAKPYEKKDILISTGVLLGNDQIGLDVVSSSKNVGKYSFSSANADGTLSGTQKYINTPLRNYNLTLEGFVNIVAKTISPDDIVPVLPEYNGEEQSPEVVIRDKETGEELVPGEDFNWGGDTEATDVSEEGYEITADLVDGGNYTGEIPVIPWNVRPKAITIKIAEEKMVDGKTFIVEGIWPTGIKTESFEYVYETDDSAIGVYSVENGNVSGGYEPADEGTLLTNYAVDEDIVLTISGEPEPDVPEYVPGQTGDSTPVAGFAIMALTLIGAFLFLRRPKKVQGLHIR